MKEKKSMTSFGVRVKQSFKKDWQLYVLILPTLIYVIIFNYVPIYGLQVAFQDYHPAKGFGDEWIGFEHFMKFFKHYQFWPVMRNTLWIGVYNMAASFFPPIILALILHNTMNQKFKAFAQTMFYAPHFISMVVVCSMVILMLSPSSGVVNSIIAALGGERINFMALPEVFPHIYVWTGVWQEIGWSSIIYLSALAGADQQLYEAAKVDGANRFQRLVYLDIPMLIPTAIILLIMQCGSVLGANTQKVLLLQNSLNVSTSEVIGTLVHKTGIVGAKYGYSTAVGLFQNVINVIMLVTVNWIARKKSDTSLW